MTADGFHWLYEEGPCFAVAKPGGLLTQAPLHIDSLEARVRRFLQRRDGRPGRVYLGVPHRLDRPVSGVLVFARHVRAARRISRQFEQRTVDKKYWALLEGDLSENEEEWVDLLRKVPDQPRGEIVDTRQPDTRVAVLRYRRLCRGDGCTLVEITLQTGRYHQIRVQAASRGHPVVGDVEYGSTRPFGPAVLDHRERWIGLHARSLQFDHPMHYQSRTITAPIPPCWPPFVLELAPETHQTVSEGVERAPSG